MSTISANCDRLFSHHHLVFLLLFPSTVVIIISVSLAMTLTTKRKYLEFPNNLISKLILSWQSL